MNITGAGIIIKDSKNNILVLHRNKEVPEGELWGLPGGKVAENQEPIEAAKKKTFQESGFKFENDQLIYLGEFKFQAEGNQITYSVWVAEINSERPEIALNRRQ